MSGVTSLSSSSSSWSCLPEVTWHGVAAFLPARDVLSLLSSNRELYLAGKHSDALWTSLLAAQFRHFSSEGGGVDEHNDSDGLNDAAAESHRGSPRQRRRDRERGEEISRSSPSRSGRVRSRSRRNRRGSVETAAEGRRQEYLALSYRQDLPAVEWVPLSAPAASAPSPREGHLSCVLDDRYLVITGGYSTDTNVYVKDLRAHPSQSEFHVLEPSHVGEHDRDDGHNDDDRQQRQRQRRPQFTYGASLTPLNGRQAVQFGGFRAGGYSHECHQVAVLTVDVTHGFAGNGNGAGAGPVVFTASWQVVTTSTDTPSTLDLETYTKRAYHTATLVFDRYLLVLGGMQSGRSVWDPALLDTRTWRWTLPTEAAQSAVVPLGHYVPPRHGHTALWDCKRSRLVVFGGGTGNDLLRSGIDHADVWGTTLPVDGVESLVRLLGIDEDDGPFPWTQIADARSEHLSPAELLCLGRCHVGHCIAPDTVLLAFGSGRPSTNGVLAFNLATNTFFRPRVSGPLPCPRFTTTSVLWDSYLIVHGGYTSQRSSGLGDMHVLDLAPALKRTFRAFPRERRVAPAGGGFAQVTDEDVIAIQNRGRPQGMGELEALISLLHNRGNMNEEDFNLTLQNLFPADLLRAGIRRVIGVDDDEEDDEEDEDDDQRNLDAEMEE